MDHEDSDSTRFRRPGINQRSRQEVEPAQSPRMSHLPVKLFHFLGIEFAESPPGPSVQLDRRLQRAALVSSQRADPLREEAQLHIYLYERWLCRRSADLQLETCSVCVLEAE